MKYVLGEEMEIMWGKRRRFNGTPYDISGQFAPQTQDVRGTQDTPIMLSR